MTAWIFTFGHGQRLRSTNRMGRADFAWNGAEIGEGFALHNRYVRIEGEHDEARARMFAVFGQVWSMEYEEGPETTEMIEQYGLVELDITEPIGAGEQHAKTDLRDRFGEAWPSLETLGLTALDVRPDMQAEPWADIDPKTVSHGMVRRVGFLRNATVSGNGGIALMIVLDDGRTVVAETTYRLAYTAARAIAASPAAAEEDVSS